MPFQDDTGVDRETTRGPLAGAFAAFVGQLERVVVVNLAWAVHVLPALLALAVPGWPVWAGVVGVVYTALALPPATAWLYLMSAHIARHDHISVELARETLPAAWRPGYTVLMPLLGTFGVLATGVGWANANGWVLPSALLQLALLLLFTTATWWGVLLAEDPTRNGVTVAREAALLTWRYPLRTVLVMGAVLVCALIGVVSVGGVFLAVPVLIALLQTEMFTALRGEI